MHCHICNQGDNESGPLIQICHCENDENIVHAVCHDNTRERLHRGFRHSDIQTPCCKKCDHAYTLVPKDYKLSNVRNVLKRALFENTMYFSMGIIVFVWLLTATSIARIALSFGKAWALIRNPKDISIMKVLNIYPAVLVMTILFDFRLFIYVHVIVFICDTYLLSCSRYVQCMFRGFARIYCQHRCLEYTDYTIVDVYHSHSKHLNITNMLHQTFIARAKMKSVSSAEAIKSVTTLFNDAERYEDQTWDSWDFECQNI
jgi:hypothetical protein